MNFLALVNRLRMECAGNGADITSVTSQSAENTRFITWINAAWLDLQNMRTDWLWLRTSVAFPTVSGRAVNTATQIGITDFGAWARDSFRNYSNPVVTMTIASPCVVSMAANALSAGDTVVFATTGALPTGLTAGTTYYVVSPTTDTFQVSATVSGSAINTTGSQSGVHTMTSNNTTIFSGLQSEIFMDYIGYDEWRDTYEIGATRNVRTRPTQVSISPAKSLVLGPFPSDGYTVVGDYYSAPSEMASETDIPALPVKFHLAIVYRAMILYGFYTAASEVIQRGEAETEKWTRRILADQLAEMTAGPALA